MCAFFGEHLRRRALCDDCALLQANDLSTQQKRFFDIVGDRDDGDTELSDALLHAREQGVAQAAIEAGEGLIEQHQPGRWNREGSGKIDALALPTGEVVRHAVGQGAEFE